MNAEKFAVVWIANDPDGDSGITVIHPVEGSDEKPRYSIFDTKPEADAERERWATMLGQQSGAFYVASVPGEWA